MQRWLVRLFVLALVAAVVALVFETRRLAEQLGEQEALRHRAELAVAASSSGQAAEAAPAESQPVESQRATTPPATTPPAASPPAAAGSAPAIELSEFARTKLELHTTKQQLAAVRQLLAERNAEMERRTRAAAERAARLLKPMPGGVRSCLERLHECLRTEGYQDQRFLRASSLDDIGLHHVEMLDASVDGLGTAFVSAGTMTAELDRSVGSLTLRFFDGHRSSEGERASLPEKGLPIVFREVDGRLLEERLPMLVKCVGAYPADDGSLERPATDLDPGSRRQWLARFERVLDRAKTQLAWRATRLRGLKDGKFLTVELVATNDKGLVLGGAHCGRVAFEIDEQAGVVSLLLQDGVLRQDGTKATITAEGYRMLLPGLTPKETIDAMLGMVVRR